MTRHHLALQLALAAAGCSHERRDMSAAAEPTVTTTATMATATIATATAAPVAVVRASASAAPAPAIGEQLKNAPALIYRALDTGAINARSTLVTRRLQRFEDQALLTVETQTVNNSGALTPTHLKPFGAPRIQWFVGSVSTAGKQTTFDLRDAHDKTKLECEMGTVQVAAANAVRRSKRQSDCGDRGHWVPGATQQVEVLRCGVDKKKQETDFKPDRFEEMAFIASPGIEFLFVNDDCVMQGGGYRFIPADGSVAAVRAPNQ